MATEETEEAVRRVQEFDASTLARREALGASFNFDEAVSPARRLIALYQQIPVANLREVTDHYRNIIRENANSVYSVFNSILDFDPAQLENPNAERASLVNQLGGAYETSFNQLFPIVSYLASRQQDFSALERQARAAVQSAEDQAARLTDHLAKTQAEANSVLDEVRSLAAESGVSQQAFYFKAEADDHNGKADQGRNTLSGRL